MNIGMEYLARITKIVIQKYNIVPNCSVQIDPHAFLLTEAIGKVENLLEGWIWEREAHEEKEKEGSVQQRVEVEASLRGVDTKLESRIETRKIPHKIPV
jgi:hypothetical protein